MTPLVFAHVRLACARRNHLGNPPVARLVLPDTPLTAPGMTELPLRERLHKIIFEYTSAADRRLYP